CFAHSNPSPGNPVPMDIDAAWKAKALLDACRCCGETGHWAKDCPLCFNVRFMDTDELQMELEGKLAAQDAVSTETESVDSEADFVPRDE
ncbi:MAG TPA: zinc finger CCHC domain-containing protein, partial [Pyrinomonadaceae bacterium]|nr:zinc finger CCHC domain-containing protein [Pyrinomonadaceae bacterium]